MLAGSGCKSSNVDQVDINGRWELSIDNNVLGTLIFSGSRESGTVRPDINASGNTFYILTVEGRFQVDKDQVSFSLESNLAGGVNYQLDGIFGMENHMSGTGMSTQVTETILENDVTWSAQRK